jgi:serine/threonine protein kinase
MEGSEAKILRCPACGAALAPARFARSVVCTFCGASVQVDPSAVSASLFRRAYAEWNAPETYGHAGCLTLGQSHWVVRELLGRGEFSDVHLADRARWPTERVVVKTIRDPANAPRLDREWEILRKLHRSEAPGAETFSRLVPEPVVRGARAIAFRWAPGFRHTLEDVRRMPPGGVEPRVSVWMWRRILEILSFLHRSGVVHGAVVPAHILVENGEHGVRLAGYGAARESRPPGDDIRMSAAAIRGILGGSPALDALLREAETAGDAWALRERIGEAARSLFGPPAFCPLKF